jgi:hypothetical protein
VLNLISAEMKVAVALTGATSIDAIGRDVIASINPTESMLSP